MKPWPVYRDFAVKFGPTNLASEAYNNARAWAAMERLRVAVEALLLIEMYSAGVHGVTAAKALAQIGELPKD
jgi:hypothetical protein